MGRTSGLDTVVANVQLLAPADNQTGVLAHSHVLFELSQYKLSKRK
jgi:hypothetical protein